MPVGSLIYKDKQATHIFTTPVEEQAGKKQRNPTLFFLIPYNHNILLLTL